MDTLVIVGIDRAARASIGFGAGWDRTPVIVDGLTTGCIQAGDGPPVVLLHSGEFGASAVLSWEHTIDALAEHHRVVAPDWLGYGASAKVHDFTRGTAFLVSHMARVCAALGIAGAPFVANSLGASLLLADASSPEPMLPATAIVAICGGGAVLDNEHYAALIDYDLTREAMRRILVALFADSAWHDDDAYLDRRYELSKEPGAWQCASAARLRPPHELAAPKRAAPAYERIAVPILLIAGDRDKLKPRGWADEVAARARGAQVRNVDAGHCPQLELPELVNAALIEFLAQAPSLAPSLTDANHN